MMKTKFSNTTLSGLLLALVVGLAGLQPASAAKAEFERTKPHINVGASGSIAQPGSGIAFDLLVDLQIFADETARGGMSFVFADGTVHLLAAAGAMVQTDNGEPTKVIVFLTPITAHVRSSQNETPETEEVWVAFLQSNSNGTIDIDIAGIFNLSSTQLEFQVPGILAVVDE